MRKKVALLALSGLLSGCQMTSSGIDRTQQSSTQDTSSSINASVVEQSEISSCTQELYALQQVSLPTYQARQTELANIQAQEKVYLKVRGDINKNSVTIMDAAYQYKISKICNDIQNDLTNELVSKAENAYQPKTRKLFSLNE